MEKPRLARVDSLPWMNAGLQLAIPNHERPAYQDIAEAFGILGRFFKSRLVDHHAGQLFWRAGFECDGKLDERRRQRRQRGGRR